MVRSLVHSSLCAHSSMASLLNSGSSSWVRFHFQNHCLPSNSCYSTLFTPISPFFPDLRLSSTSGRPFYLTNIVCSSAQNDSRVELKEGSPNDGSQSETPTSEFSETDLKQDKLGKEISKAVRKTAGTFAPRASAQKGKNPAVPGTTLYSVFELQGYISMAIGGLLSFNLLFPSEEPDIWRLMGMWSIWMFTVPSLRARDCSNKEKEALNYLFLIIPLINVILPIAWKSFAAVWTADVLAFFAMYAYKLEWLNNNTASNQDDF